MIRYMLDCSRIACFVVLSIYFPLFLAHHSVERFSVAELASMLQKLCEAGGALERVDMPDAASNKHVETIRKTLERKQFDW